MPIRTTNKKEQTATGKRFTRESLSALGDDQLKELLGIVDLTEYLQNFERPVAITRILQEQVHGFSMDLDEPVFDKFFVSAVKAAEPKTRSKSTVKGDEDQHEPGALHVSAGQTGSVTYGIKEVKNIGNYESLHITASVTLPVGAGPDEIQAAQATLLVAKELCITQIENDMKELAL